MNLQETADNLFDDSKSTPLRGLAAIAEAERYLQQAYEGRYFFELIQNVRDANKENEQDGEIYIEFKENVLSISNTGAEFSTKGIEGITTIGKSTKQSQDYIGFKGIGFKSVQEISETPKIITRHGSVFFDRNLTLEKYNNPTIREEDLPLFYFPHFKNVKLSNAESESGIVTKIELPVKPSITEEIIVADFKKIHPRQLILLGNIKQLNFKSSFALKYYQINKNPQKHFIEVREDDKSSAKFRYYEPKSKVLLPKEVVQSLEGREKEIFINSSQVDINIVLELSDNGQVNPIVDAKLYLFYPLDITSGFRFIIHSYFIVNPERKSLRESPLNDYLLTAIGNYIGSEMLKHLIKSRTNTNKILCFKRNNDAKLNALYDSVVRNLKLQRFIFDSQTKKYYYPNEVIVADGFDKGLFMDGRLGDRQLIYSDDTEIIEWLRKEFEIPYLSYEDISNQIELECKRQQRLKHIKFFKTLYNYVSKHENLILTGRKVFLTDDWKLVSSEEDVFYGGGRKNPINLSLSIKKQIHFIHKDIKITDFRDGRSKTGITEFNTNELIRRLLKLFNLDSVPNADIINALFHLEIDAKSEIEIREKILLPIKGSAIWLSPILNPIYFDTEELRLTYPNGNFVDQTILKDLEGDQPAVSKKAFLKKFGVWEIPAIYIGKKPTCLSEQDSRDSILSRFSALRSRPYYINNDRILDKPFQFNIWFTNAIIDNWNTYQTFITSSSLPRLQFFSQQSSNFKNVEEDMILRLSDFIESLKTNKWISFKGEDDQYLITDVIGIKLHDFNQGYNHFIRKYIKLLPIPFDLKLNMIETLGLIHLDGNSVKNYAWLFKQIHKKYETNIPTEKDFVDFYNKMLGKLFEYFYDHEQPEDIVTLREEYFLGIDGITNNLCWAKAKDIFYIDDKPNYDLLPILIKEKLQPQFTTRDKKTFGKIAGRIGRKFSSSLKKKLIESGEVETNWLVSYFKFLPESIALLESSLDIILSDHFEALKSIQVLEKEDLKISVSLEKSNETVISVNHFIEPNSNYNIHLSKIFLNKNKQIAEAISELFIILLERDLRKFNSDLFRFMNIIDKSEYLRDSDISDERVNEIREKLNSADLTPNQRFWNAVLSAKHIASRENIFTENSTNTTTLSQILGLENSIIPLFQNEFDFIKTSAVSNMPLLFKLFKQLSLTLPEINENLYPKIDFRDFHIKKLKILKNKFKNGFASTLHSYLLTKDIKEQENYQDFLDEYEKHTPFQIPIDTIEFGITNFFLLHLHSQFTFLSFTKADFDKGYEDFNPIQIYAANINLLKIKITSIRFSNDSLQSFLAENKRRSLLYFDHIDTIFSSFSTWLKRNEGGDIPTDNDADIESFLNAFSNSSTTQIEILSTNSIEVPASKAGAFGGGNGRRFDGGAGDQNKKRIGLVAEMLVFDKLKEQFSNTIWVSKFASKVHKTHCGYNPEGQDGLGYDIEYLDAEGNKYYVEVKGKADSYDVFEISKNEIEKANQEKEFYKFIFVTQTMNNTQRRILDLGNILLLDQGEDFFSNRKFTALYKNFEIRFKGHI
jgi:hypothetical protein